MSVKEGWPLPASERSREREGRWRLGGFHVEARHGDEGCNAVDRVIDTGHGHHSKEDEEEDEQESDPENYFGREKKWVWEKKWVREKKWVWEEGGGERERDGYRRW